MKTKKFILALSILIGSFSIASAQIYDNSVGLRLGSSNSFVFKHFLSSNSAVELMAGTRWRGFNVVGLYEMNTTAFQVERLQFYYGAGGHIGGWHNYRNHPWFDNRDRNHYVVVGVDAILGLEYAFEGAPISLSIDWKPEFNIIGYSGLWGGDGGLSIRYYW